ncbi:acyl-CoA synthetase, partial [Streptococcus suis]
WIAGPAISRGYHGRPQESAEAFGARVAEKGGGAAAPFLRSGDLGFLHQGELFVTGRRKDVIIVHGRNLYAQDVEELVEREAG